jgi:ABC-type sugar transport system permease subunit
MYRQAFQQNHDGYASAVAIVLVVIMLLSRQYNSCLRGVQMKAAFLN